MADNLAHSLHTASTDDGAKTPVNNLASTHAAAAGDNSKQEKTASTEHDNGISDLNDGPLHKSLTSSTGNNDNPSKAEPDNAAVVKDREDGTDLEGAKPVAVQDESKLLHGGGLYSISPIHSPC